MMGIGRLGQSQQRLQQPLDMGGGQQVFAARHQGHALEGVIHHHRQMIGGRQSLRASTMSPKRKGSTGMAHAMFDEGQRPGQRRRLGHIQPQRIGFRPPRCGACRLPATVPAGAGIERHRPGPCMRRFAGARDFVGDLLAGAEAGIDQAVRLQVRQRLAHRRPCGADWRKHRLVP